MQQLTESQRTQNILMVVKALNRLVARRKPCPTCKGSGFIL